MREKFSPKMENVNQREFNKACFNDESLARLVDELKEQMIFDGLGGKGISTYRISKIVPDYTSDNEKKYYLSMHDGHPNAFINEIIAEYVVNNILEK